MTATASTATHKHTQAAADSAILKGMCLADWLSLKGLLDQSLLQSVKHAVYFFSVHIDIPSFISSSFIFYGCETRFA